MQFEASPALLITCGVTAIAAAVLGIYSATMLQRPILFIYMGVLIFIIVLNMITGIMGLFYQSIAMTLASKYRASRLDLAIRTYGSESDSTDILANVQGRSWIDLNQPAVEENSNRPPLCDPCNSTVDPMTCGQYTFQNTTVNITFEALNKGCVDDFQRPAAQLDIAVSAVVGGFSIAFATIPFGLIGVAASIGIICCITNSHKTHHGLRPL